MYVTDVNDETDVTYVTDVLLDEETGVTDVTNETGETHVTGVGLDVVRI